MEDERDDADDDDGCTSVTEGCLLGASSLGLLCEEGDERDDVQG